MFIEILYDFTISQALSLGWNVPTYDEVREMKDIESMLSWLIEHNPDKEQVIKDKFAQLKKIIEI